MLELDSWRDELLVLRRDGCATYGSGLELLELEPVERELVSVLS